jgi:hypothetical protein
VKITYEMWLQVCFECSGVECFQKDKTVSASAGFSVAPGQSTVDEELLEVK